MPRSPYASYAENLFDEFSSDSEIARAIRCGDARLRWQELQVAEESLREREQEIAAIGDAVERRQSRHAFDIDCLIRFGCRADERATFCEILSGVAKHGGSTLSQAAELAKTICKQRTDVVEALHQRSGQASELGVDVGSDAGAGRV